MGPGKVIAGSLTVPMPADRAASTTSIVLRLVGRTLVVAGALVLAFVGYQLWGTGLAEQRAQQTLVEEFATVIDQMSTTGGTPEEGVVPEFDPAPGDAVARIRIPDIGVDKVVVWGTDLGDLRDGPGLYAGTPLPGQRGNAAIAGHRTTYGAPFARLDELRPGDLILVDTVYGTARYRVAGSEVVAPQRIDVVEGKGDDRLTLTTCHPRFSDARRLVVWGMLETAPPTTAPNPISTTRSVATTTSTLVESEPTTLVGTIGWGLATAALVGGVTFAARRPRRLYVRVGIRAAATPPALVGLYFCFADLERLLPLY